MRNKKLSLGMLVMLLAFGMSVVGCENPTNGGGTETGIPQEWRITYAGDEGRTITVGENFMIFMNMSWPGTILYGNGTLTGMSIGQGGTITMGAGGAIGGTYVYLLRYGQRLGILAHIGGMGRFLGIGNIHGDGAHEIISTVQSGGGVFNPSVNLSGMPTDFAWGGGSLY